MDKSWRIWSLKKIIVMNKNISKNIKIIKMEQILKIKLINNYKNNIQRIIRLIKITENK